MRVRSFALVGCVLASGCYLGSARTATPADLAPGDDSWNGVEGVPAVRQTAREDCGAAPCGAQRDRQEVHGCDLGAGTT